MTQLGGMVLSEPSTTQFSGVTHHYFYIFLQTCYFHVLLGNVLSARHFQDNGVPQGLVLSVTVFVVSISGVENAVGPSVATWLYVDNVAIFFQSQSIVTIENWLQGIINSLLIGSREWMFTFHTLVGYTS
jgi:hypothetical protein